MKRLLVAIVFFLFFNSFITIVAAFLNPNEGGEGGPHEPPGNYSNTWNCCQGTDCISEGCSQLVVYSSLCIADQCTVGTCRPECGCITTTTTTVPPSCGIPGRCEPGENQTSCPNDCYTTVFISPNVAVVPGQNVTLEIAFNDSRYLAGHNAKYSLTVDGIVWNANNGCNIASVNVTPITNGIGTTCTWQGMPTKQCTSTSVDGYLKVTTICNLPYNLQPTTHSLIATPAFYSQETILSEASTKFTTQQKFDFFEWIFSFFR
jgi:hypothetical protein